MTTIQYQFLSLIVSVLVVLSMGILFIFKKRVRFYYIAMIVGWLPGIVYYVSVLWFQAEFLEHFQIPALDISAALRTFQYLIFGSWFVFDAIEELYKHVIIEGRYNKLKEAIKNLTKGIEKQDEH